MTFSTFNNLDYNWPLTVFNKVFILNFNYFYSKQKKKTKKKKTQTQTQKRIKIIFFFNFTFPNFGIFQRKPYS